MRFVSDRFTELKLDSQREIFRMSDDQRLLRAREEYECLKVVQMEDMTKYQAEITDLKQVRFTCCLVIYILEAAVHIQKKSHC